MAVVPAFIVGDFVGGVFVDDKSDFGWEIQEAFRAGRERASRRFGEQREVKDRGLLRLGRCR